MKFSVHKLILALASCGLCVAALAQQAPAAKKAEKPELPALPAKVTNLDIAKEEVMPLTPEEISQLKKSLDQSRRAASAHPTAAPPQPVSRSVDVDLSPGSPPVVARLFPGHVSTLSFVDLTGAAWPINAIINGDPKSFDIKAVEAGSNTVTIASLGWYSVGNVAVMLKDLPSPVTVTLVGGQKEVDYRLDMRVPSRGPNAIPQKVLGSGVTPSQNTDMLSILDGVAPKDSKALRVEGEGQAWSLNGNIVYRTRSPLLSPAWLNKVQSSDGTFVYEIPYVPVLLISTGGVTKEVRVSQ